MRSSPIRSVFIAAMLFAAMAGLARPALAQASRTWVSGVGDDVNPCSRTAPCKTFAGAISKTAAAGEINCLDSGGFGSVTITKAIAIVCDGVEGGIAANGTTGIIVKAGPDDVVLLSGLDIEGAGTGLHGVRFLSGRSLAIRNTTIRMFGTADSAGVWFDPSATARLYLHHVWISDNNIGIRAGGASGVAAQVFMSSSNLLGNVTGLAVLGGGAIHSRGGNVLANDRDGAFASSQPAK